MAKLNVGDRAPDFTLPSHDGREVSLEELRRDSVLVLFFYPKDGSPVCTKEACAFRDSYEDFTEAGAVVAGISADPTERHRSFAEANRLPFVLLSDPGGKAARDYGVSKTLGLLPGRVTFVIDSEGIVRHQFRSQLSAQEHVQGALRMVEELAGAKRGG
jgi:peroxiredoxin Q/BCP